MQRNLLKFIKDCTIPHYNDFWKEKFPKLLNHSIAMSEYNTTAIVNLVTDPFKIGLNYCDYKFSGKVIYRLFNALKKLQRFYFEESNHDYNRQLSFIKFTSINPKIMVLEPIHSDIILICSKIRNFQIISNQIGLDSCNKKDIQLNRESIISILKASPHNVSGFFMCNFGKNTHWNFFLLPTMPFSLSFIPETKSIVVSLEKQMEMLICLREYQEYLRENNNEIFEEIQDIILRLTPNLLFFIPSNDKSEKMEWGMGITKNKQNV